MRHPLVTGAGINSLGTLASRVLGLLRDVATAALLGLSGGGAMDAFVVAFRIPNLFRRLLGEGALAASYLPVITAELERDRRTAWQVASVVLAWLAVVLAAVVLAAEGACGVAWLLWGDAPRAGLLLGLTAAMLPYLWFICLAAQVSATLHALGHFTVPALAPSLLNVCWLAAAWLIAPALTADKTAQAYVLAGAVLVGGAAQLGVQLPVLRRYGFRFDYHWPAARDAVRQITLAMGPMLMGLAVTQINTLVDSLLAWGLSARGAADSIAWLGGVGYPMQPGAAAAIYYGERVYQFPLGLLGIAVATAIFPILSRHAARGDRLSVGADLTLGLRLVLVAGVPASAGLVILAGPLARLLFEHGAFTADDAARTARMIGAYGVGVWSYCALPVVVRGYYAAGDRATPVRVGTAAVGLNLAMNLVLVWPLAEMGLAVATAASSVCQLAVLTSLFSRRRAPLVWRQLTATAVRTLIATAAMTAAALGVLTLAPGGTELTARLARVFLPMAVGAAVYLEVYVLIGRRELGALVTGRDA